MSEELLERLKSTRSAIEFLAVLNRYMEERGLGRVIITGGYAVELYTSRAYRTGDVDVIVVGGSAFFEGVLKSLGAQRVGRGYELPQIIAYTIDVVSTSYTKPRDPIRVRVGDCWVYIEPPEEVVVSCLNACKYWSSDFDCEKALMVIVAQRDHIDFKYLERRCGEESTLDTLRKLLEYLPSNSI